MKAIATSRTRGPRGNELGVLLRHWRNLRGKSQLDLSLDSGMSQRHLSFVESGRSGPSREKLMAIAEALDVPLRERNTLLLAAGYAPLYADTAWDAPEMKSVTRALDRMLRQHEPFPAVVMDRYWNVLMANASTPRFFNGFIDMRAREGRRNLIHLMFDPDGMRPFLANWEQAAEGLLGRVTREAVGRVLDETTKQLLSALLAYPDVKAEWKVPQVSTTLLVVPLSFVKEDKLLHYFSMITTVGTPQTIAAQELRIECLFPVDEATEQHHLELMRSVEAAERRPSRRFASGVESPAVDDLPGN